MARPMKVNNSAISNAAPEMLAVSSSHRAPFGLFPVSWDWTWAGGLGVGLFGFIAREGKRQRCLRHCASAISHYHAESKSPLGFCKKMRTQSAPKKWLIMAIFNPTQSPENEFCRYRKTECVAKKCNVLTTVAWLICSKTEGLVHELLRSLCMYMCNENASRLCRVARGWGLACKTGKDEGCMGIYCSCVQ